MARYQLRRPSPIKIAAKIRRWQALDPSSTLFTRSENDKKEKDENEMDEGPESPDSPESSPSSAGSSSDDSDSDDDEPPSATKSSESPTSSQAPATLGPDPTTTLSSGTSSASSRPTVASNQTTSAKSIAAALPQVTIPSSTLSTAVRPITATTIVFSSKIARPTQPASSSTSQPPALPSGISRAPVAENDPPRKSSPEHEPTLMSKGAQVAAITLSIFGALALVIGAILYYKRRKRIRSQQGHTEDSFNPDNAGSLRAPEVVHIDNSSPFGGGGSHLTRSTDRSDTLFGPGPYTRPETVSTNASRSRVAAPQPTPNPFADPPLNKAYDVLAGRPRSTTLTDRGSWVKNPFKNPESERFDPFGELQAKARMERVRYMEEARREAERQRQFEEKERMGLVPEQAVLRNGSGVTLEGMGVLDRASGRNGYP